MQAERIERIEVKLERHSTHLSKIQQTIDQLRWIASGMILFWVLTEVGVFAGLKLVM